MSTAAESQRRVTTGLAAVVALAALVVGALLLNGQQAATDLLRRGRTEARASEWLTESERHRLQSIETDGDLVIVSIVGPRIGTPAADDLAADLSDEFDRSMQAEVRLTIEQVFMSDTTP